MEFREQSIAPVESKDDVGVSSVDFSEGSRFGAPDQDKLLDALQQLWAQRALLLRGLVCGLLIFTAIAFLIPARYDAITRLMPPDNQSTTGLAMLSALAGGSSASSGLATAIGSDLLGMKSSGALFIGIMHSRTAEDYLVNRFDLRRHYSKRRWEDARRKLEDRTDIAEDRKSGIITVTITDHDPQLAAAMARAYVEELDQMVAHLTTSSAHRERVFLEDRLSTVKKELDADQKNLSEFASKNTMLDPKDQGRAMVDAAASLQGQMIAAQAQLQGLRQIYTNDNVRVRSVEARIAELQRQLNKMGGAPDDSSNDAANSLYPSIRKLPVLGATYVDLYRQAKVQEAVFETLTKQYELAKVQEAKEIPTVRVLDAAVVPERRSFPPRLAIVFGGVFLSLLATAAWILFLRFWHQLDPADPRRALASTIVGDLRIHAARMRRDRSFS